MNALARAVSLFMTSSVIGSLTQIAKGKVAAIVLGPEGVGVLNQLVALWNMFMVGARMGFGTGITRHLATYHAEADDARFQQHFSSSFFALGVVALIAAAGGVVFASGLSNAIFADSGARADFVAVIMLAVPLAVAGQVYRSLLNGTRSVSLLARARMFADVLGMIIFALMIVPLGLFGAIIGFIALHAFYLLLVAMAARRVAPSGAVPCLPAFRWTEVARNLRYAGNGLVTTMVQIVATLLVVRWIIVDAGLAESGLYTSALKVAAVYMGGIYAASFGFTLPTLAALRSDAEIGREMNKTVRFYLYLLPPVVTGLIVMAEPLILVLFSAEFLGAAVLLVLLLPADLFRVTADTCNLGLLAREKLAVSATLTVLWGGMYIGLSAVLLPVYGAVGAAMAYVLSQIVRLIATNVAIRLSLGVGMDRSTLLALARAAAFIVPVAALAAWREGDLVTMVASWLLAGLIWAGLSLLDDDFSRSVRRLVFIVRDRIIMVRTAA